MHRQPRRARPQRTRAAEGRPTSLALSLDAYCSSQGVPTASRQSSHAARADLAARSGRLRQCLEFAGPSIPSKHGHRRTWAWAVPRVAATSITPAIAWPGGAIISSLRAHALLQLVQPESEITARSHCSLYRRSGRVILSTCWAAPVSCASKSRDGADGRRRATERASLCERFFGAIGREGFWERDRRRVVRVDAGQLARRTLTMGRSRCGTERLRRCALPGFDVGVQGAVTLGAGYEGGGGPRPAQRCSRVHALRCKSREGRNRRCGPLSGRVAGLEPGGE